MTIKGPDALKSPLAGGKADLTLEVADELAGRAKSLSQLRQVSNEAALQFADAILPKVKAEQTDGLFFQAFDIAPFGWIDRMPSSFKKGSLPGESTADQLAAGFKQLYSQAAHQLHRALEKIEGRSVEQGDFALMKEQELVPIQRGLARIDAVLDLRERLTMLGQRSEINQALRDLDALATDVRTALAPLVQAIEVRDGLVLGEKMKHLGQEDEHPPVDLDALRRSNTAPAAFERYQPGDVLIIGRQPGGKPIFGSMLDAVADGTAARVLTAAGDQIEMRFVAKAEVEALNPFKLNDNYLIDGQRYWVAPDREKGARAVVFDPARPGKAPVDISLEELAAKLSPAHLDATQVAVEPKQRQLPEVIQVMHGFQSPEIMATSNRLFDGAAWSHGHEGTNDDALRMGKAGDHYAAVIADQVGFSKSNAQVSSAFIDGIWQQMDSKQVGTPHELMDRGVRVSARGLAPDNRASTSLTAGIFSEDKHGVRMDVGHIGNTQLLVIRNGSVLYKTEPHVLERGVTSSVTSANNPTRTLGNDDAGGPASLDHPNSVALKKGDVVLFISNGVRNMNLLEQKKNAGGMAQPHTEFTPYQLAEEIRGKRSPEEMVAAIRDLAVERERDGSGKAADLSVMALTIKV